MQTIPESLIALSDKVGRTSTNTQTMKPFLEEVADHILSRYPDSTGDICLVTPNRRAGLFFRSHLSARITRPIWAPEVLSIEDFINRISGLVVYDNISLLFAFYKVYSRLEGTGAKPIDDFMRWAPALLRDFDEIEATLEEPDQIFDYLKDVKRIETWNPDGSPPTPFQENYLAFFSKLKHYHHEFTASLLQQNKAYQGLSSRQAATKAREGTLEVPWKKVVFTGFNALNRAEETIIHALLKAGKADFLPDFDPYYVSDPRHEAGFFIRKYLKKWNLKKEEIPSPFTTGKKQIRILGIAKNVNQARLAGNILDQAQGPGLNVDTAVVLANEDLLIPVLNALPAEAESINVTMGYPLQKTNMFGFFDALFQLFMNAGKLRRDRTTSPPPFYHKDLYRFFSHSCSELLWDGLGIQDHSSRLIRALAASNRSFFHYGELQSLERIPQNFHEGFAFLAGNWNDHPETIFPSLLDLVSRLDGLFRKKAGSHGKDIVNTPFFLDFESLYYFATLFRRIQAFLTESPFLGSLQTLYTLFKQMASESRLSFSGEPLKGLQVMGVLETRNLDFKNVLLLSANEGVIPRPRTNHSFVPYDVKRKFGLQVHTEKDATYAYHFYRLLQRAESVYLVYNTQTQDMGSSEKSRYITQLQHELQRINPGIEITEEIVSLPPPQARPPQTISITKTPEITDRLMAAAKKGFSPSALGLYITCPLQFYLSRVARLEESETVEETIDASTMGTVIHGVLEEMFRPYTGKELHPEHIGHISKDVDRLTHEQFELHYPKGDIQSGKNLLLFHLARQYVSTFLMVEKRFVEEAAGRGMPVRLIALEKWLEAGIKIEPGGEPCNISIRGKADRIDSLGDTTRIIDYKTGKVQDNELKFDQWEEVTKNSRNGKAFQLLTYAWLYHKMFPGTPSIEPGIASMRSANKGVLTLKLPEGKGALNAGHLASFEESLRALLGEIMDPDTSFSQTEDETNCAYCPYRAVCRRF